MVADVRMWLFGIGGVVLGYVLSITSPWWTTWSGPVFEQTLTVTVRCYSADTFCRVSGVSIDGMPSAAYPSGLGPNPKLLFDAWCHRWACPGAAGAVVVAPVAHPTQPPSVPATPQQPAKKDSPSNADGAAMFLDRSSAERSCVSRDSSTQGEILIDGQPGELPPCQ